jgi:hypothetical protein
MFLRGTLGLSGDGLVASGAYADDLDGDADVFFDQTDVILSGGGELVELPAVADGVGEARGVDVDGLDVGEGFGVGGERGEFFPG